MCIVGLFSWLITIYGLKANVVITMFVLATIMLITIAGLETTV